MVKVTFTIDDETARRLRKLSERARKPQSLIVREAIAHYAAAEEDVRVPENERDRQLAILRRIRAQGALRSAEDADAELQALRESRREPQRGHKAE